MLTAPTQVNTMEVNKMLDYIKSVLENMPSDWLKLTTHRLDIFDEKKAKTAFIEQFQALFKENIAKTSALRAIVNRTETLVFYTNQYQIFRPIHL